jgi:LTXXQ motif family protein
MQPAIKVVLLAVGLATGPSAAAILSATSTAPKGRPIDVSFLGGRAAEAEGYEFDVPIEPTRAMDDRWDPSSGAASNVPVQFGSPHPRGPFGFARPEEPPSSRVACEEEIDRVMGLAAYLKSKMRLQDGQKTAWQKVEQAAVPGAEKIRDLCARLPPKPAQLNFLERIDFAEMQISARLELLHATHEPLQALYETLSSDQRALLTVGLRFVSLMPPPQEPRPW